MLIQDPTGRNYPNLGGDTFQTGNGRIPVGETSAMFSYTLFNAVPSQCHGKITNLSFGRTVVPPFRIVSNTCGSEIDPGGSCAITFDGTPQKLGEVWGELRVNYDGRKKDNYFVISFVIEGIDSGGSGGQAWTPPPPPPPPPPYPLVLALADVGGKCGGRSRSHYSVSGVCAYGVAHAR